MSLRRPVLAVLAAALCALVAAALAWAPRSAAADFRLARVVGGVPTALFVTSPPGDPRLFVVEQSGTVRIVRNGRMLARPFLNVSGRIVAGGEQGLLGLAFHPRYRQNGRLFVNYTNRSGDTRVVEYRVSRDRNRVDPRSARTLLAIGQPYPNHNGGMLAFGPDRMFYVGTGDGGSGGDPHNHGQRLDSLLGKILRIDVDHRSGRRPYAIPGGNPFAGRPGARPEIWAYGLRNPWRFSFDRARGDLWIGDVGQNAVEEIDYVAAGQGAGANFGWRAFEGSTRYAEGGPAFSQTVAPVAEYDHSRGFSVTGGYVYRGRSAPALQGRYVYADYGTGRVWSLRAGPTPGGLREHTGALNVKLSGVTSFGEDARGELYVIANGALFRFVRG